MPQVSVALLKPADEKAWDQLVHEADEASFFHLSGWRSVIETAFGHRTHYLAAHDGSRIEGILPLTHVKSRIFGNSLISNAFCVGGGPLARTTEAQEALLAEAISLGRELNVDCIEIRSAKASGLDWVTRDGVYADFRKPIAPDPEVNMKAIPRKQRAMVRKGISAGLVSELDADAGRLHDVYAQSVHRLGTPVFPRRYFELLKTQFGDACDIVTVTHDKKAVASVMNFYFRDEVLPYYGGGTKDARLLAANDFMYWEVMRRASARGSRVFDFGRSKVGTGAYDFKRYWGFEPSPLSYKFCPIARAELPDNNPMSSKYRLMVSAWQKLPLFVTKLVGPMIVRSIG